MEKCKNCKYWEVSLFDIGVCHALPGDKVYVELDGGLTGCLIKEIETDGDFYCAYFAKRRGELKKR